MCGKDTSFGAKIYRGAAPTNRTSMILNQTRLTLSGIRCLNKRKQNFIPCWSKRTINTPTYYDSQSGQHVPIHDETRISGYLLSNRKESFQEILDTAASCKLSGALFHARTLEDDLTELSESEIASSLETLFLHLPPSAYRNLGGSLPKNNDNNNSAFMPKNINLCLEYTSNDGQTNLDPITHAIQQVYSTYGTSIGIFDPTTYTEDPISVAAQVANIIDMTGGCCNILLSPSLNDDVSNIDTDDLIALCGELSYLDVPGPTVKSRLLVRAMNEEQVEECLQMGVSKFLLMDEEESFDMLRRVVSSEGKELIGCTLQP
jgi:hypothetical protein